MCYTQDMKYVNQITPVLKKYGVVRAAIFGSVARGEDDEQSDLDLLVQLDPKKKMDLLDYASLKIDLEERVGRSVDLVQYSKIKPMLSQYIMKDMVEVAL